MITTADRELMALNGELKGDILLLSYLESEGVSA